MPLKRYFADGAPVSMDRHLDHVEVVALELRAPVYFLIVMSL
jgi:hypothetical protein